MKETGKQGKNLIMKNFVI